MITPLNAGHMSSVTSAVISRATPGSKPGFIRRRLWREAGPHDRQAQNEVIARDRHRPGMATLQPFAAMDGWRPAGACVCGHGCRRLAFSRPSFVGGASPCRKSRNACPERAKQLIPGQRPCCSTHLRLDRLVGSAADRRRLLRPFRAGCPTLERRGRVGGLRASPANGKPPVPIRPDQRIIPARPPEPLRLRPHSPRHRAVGFPTIASRGRPNAVPPCSSSRSGPSGRAGASRSGRTEPCA